MLLKQVSNALVFATNRSNKTSFHITRSALYHTMLKSRLCKSSVVVSKAKKEVNYPSTQEATLSISHNATLASAMIVGATAYILRLKHLRSLNAVQRLLSNEQLLQWTCADGSSSHKKLT